MSTAINSPQDLENIVILASDPTKSFNEIKVKTATSILDSIRNELPVNTAALQCIQLLDFTDNVHAKFFAWSTLQLCLFPRKDVRNSPRGIIDETTRYQIRKMILHSNDKSNQNTMKTLIPKESFLRTQVGIVMALLIQVDYPVNWSNAFDDIIQNLVIFTSINEPDDQFLKMDLFLRILDGVCDEIVETKEDRFVHERNTMIKDEMRGFASSNGSRNGYSTGNKNSIVYRIMDTLINISRHYILISQRSPTDSPQNNLAPFAFSVLKRFIPWIDISFILNEPVMTLLYSSLSGKCVGDADEDISTALAIQSIDCLHEVVSRGMTISKKIQLLTDINLFPNLINIHSSPSSPGVNLNENTNIYLAIKVAQLINTSGVELMECWEKQNVENEDIQCEDTLRKTAHLLQQFIPLFFMCFIYDDIDVTGAVLQVASSIAIGLGKEIKQQGDPKYKYFSLSPYLSRFLTEIYKQLQYPNDFQFNQNSEDDAEEQVFRYDLRKLYIKLIRVSPKEISLQFLCQVFAHIPIPLSSTPPMPLEAALRLLFHYSEGIRPNASSVMKMEPFFELVLALHKSDVSLHPLGEILILYFDIAVRYLDIFKTKPELLPRVLEAITGRRGLQHPHSVRMRSRSCYSLLRLVKGMSKEGRMKEYVETAVRGIESLLSNPDLHLDHDDTLYLFETIGLLLGTPGNLSAEAQIEYLRAVISPHIRSIESTLQSPNLQRDPAHYGTILSQSIAALSYLSKGFGRGPQENVQIMLAETLKVALVVLQSLPNEEQVRNKTMILIQRMILCLNQDKLLPILPSFLHLLIENCTSEDVLNVSQLLNQICLKFKQNGATTLDGTLYPFIQKCEGLILSLQESFCNTASEDVKNQNQLVAPLVIPSHIEVEQKAIQKMVFSLLQHVVANKATIILMSRNNLPHLELYLQVMLEGVTKSQDPGIKKACIIFFKDLISQWGGHDDSKEKVGDKSQFEIVQSGLIHFVFQSLIPGLIGCILDPSFKERDAMQSRNVNEIAFLLVTVKDKRGMMEFDQHFIQGTLLRLNCPNDLIEYFKDANDSKQMSTCLKELMSNLKPK